MRMSLQMSGTPIAGKSVFLILEDGLYLTYIATRATPENERKCEWVVAGGDRAKFW